MASSVSSWQNIFVKWFPVVLQGIITAQALATEADGATKKKLVIDSITAGAKLGQAVPEDHVAGISQMIDASVQAFKAAGVLGFVPNPPTAPTA